MRIEQSLSVGELENTFRCLAAALRYLSLSLSGIEKRRLEYHASRVDVLLTYTKALSYWLKRGSRRGLGRARDQMMREINEIRNYLALVVKPNLSATLWK
ncbi:MAG: hypothetical protein DSY37_00845 [Hyperthermus sp.]|nr:MAG: hypothetical protein DSY37_00845 [Hyperthermus sp.]